MIIKNIILINDKLCFVMDTFYIHTEAIAFLFVIRGLRLTIFFPKLLGFINVSRSDEVFLTRI